MLRFITALMGALLLMQSAFADTTRPEIGKYVFGYRGQEGAMVWVMRIGPKAANEALIRYRMLIMTLMVRFFSVK